jgi:hypothetical protein
MNIQDLINKLNTIKDQYGDIQVTLDDLYTPASRPIRDVLVWKIDGVPVVAIVD